MQDKAHEWTVGVLWACIAWLLVECISTFMHVWAMKKYGVCPYITRINSLEGRAKRITGESAETHK